MKKNYIDIDLNFKAHPISGDISLLYDEAVVKSNIKNLIFTNFYEKPYSPKYGGNIKRYLFSKINILEKMVIREDLLEMLKKYEPRIADIEVEVEIQSSDTIIFNIWYTIISISEQQFLNLVLNRIR